MKKTPAEQAVTELISHGYLPLVTYPGVIHAPWLALCIACGITYRPSLNTLRSRRSPRLPAAGRAPCGHRIRTPGPARASRYEQLARVVFELLEAGYAPLKPFPGAAHAPWPARCVTCGQIRLTSLSKVRAGALCRHVQRESERVVPYLAKPGILRQVRDDRIRDLALAAAAHDHHELEERKEGVGITCLACGEHMILPTVAVTTRGYLGLLRRLRTHGLNYRGRGGNHL